MKVRVEKRLPNGGTWTDYVEVNVLGILDPETRKLLMIPPDWNLIELPSTEWDRIVITREG